MDIIDDDDPSGQAGDSKHQILGSVSLARTNTLQKIDSEAKPRQKSPSPDRIDRRDENYRGKTSPRNDKDKRE